MGAASREQGHPFTEGTAALTRAGVAVAAASVVMAASAAAVAASVRSLGRSKKLNGSLGYGVVLTDPSGILRYCDVKRLV